MVSVPVVMVYFRGHTVGYRKGYSQAITDHPAVVHGDYYAGEKLPFFLLKFGKLRLGI